MSKSTITIEVETHKDDDNRWVVNTKVDVKGGLRSDENMHTMIAAKKLLGEVKISE